MRYQHTNTSHQATSHRSSGFSSVAEIAGGMGLRSPQPQQLALDFAPAQVRSHGLQDAHTYPQVARSQGASFRVPASQAWGYPSLELRAGNSWPLMGFDCDVPEKVLEALVSNHWGARSDAHPALPEPPLSAAIQGHMPPPFLGGSLSSPPFSRVGSGRADSDVITTAE